MNKMYLVDYTKNWLSNPRHVIIESFENSKEVLRFILDNSHDSSFSVIRINKYEHGKLTPQHAEVVNGRFTLEATPRDGSK